MSIACLKALPLEVWNALAAALDEVERGAEWPAELRQGGVVLIAKGEPMLGIASPGELRPITVLAQVVRLWGRARMRDLRPWVAQWALAVAVRRPG